MNDIAMIAALEDLIATMQVHLSEIKANPMLAYNERWLDQVENDAHHAIDFSAYAEEFRD